MDVFTENKRVVLTLQTKEFGRVAYVLVGAMLVGSILITASRGATVMCPRKRVWPPH